MSKSFQNADRRTLVRKHLWVCLLLPLLFLCNPFLLKPASSCGLFLLHPPSYRATVASAELLKFKNPDNIGISRIVNCSEFVGFLLFPPQSQASAPRVNAEDLLPPSQFLSSNVWSRPPPAAE